ncbi:YihY/virulence factor BrkB family protein [Pseudokineococcus marinus]|uniref:YihY/virulence factor BrkB family protein n=1 Tax=Pseudokineococcus marinus TaxID=351215 RepID=A0A849BLQ8_9ACTN|nr:YihY/virulence factor BrkB family protein [Pseudokineococcus marinus]NNH24209.1 YihY/virulence factor BrkB family protein [Pseudokineococcus marinus]
MSSATHVPETSRHEEELEADDAWRTLRRCGPSLAVESFRRFRYADGFSHSRALGLQICLAALPLVVALVGLAGSVSGQDVARVLRAVVIALTPGVSRELVTATLDQPSSGGARLALWVGLVSALAVLTTAMAQVERGANRIYGVERDRPFRQRYARAAVMAVVAGLPALAGFLLLVGSGPAGDAVQELYGRDDDVVQAVAVPVGALLLVASVTAMFRHGPRRVQPGWSWLALGGLVVLALWSVLTAGVVEYVELSASFTTVYGPLAVVVALLLWGQLTSVAIYLGLAVAAQLEAVRAGVERGARQDVA